MEEPLFHPYNQIHFKLLPDQPPNLECFGENEKACLDSIIQEFYNFTATDLSNISHDSLPWDAIHDNEDVPLALISFAEFDPSKVENEEAVFLWKRSINLYPSLRFQA